MTFKSGHLEFEENYNRVIDPDYGLKRLDNPVPIKYVTGFLWIHFPSIAGFRRARASRSRYKNRPVSGNSKFQAPNKMAREKKVAEDSEESDFETDNQRKPSGIQSSGRRIPVPVSVPMITLDYSQLYVYISLLFLVSLKSLTLFHFMTVTGLSRSRWNENPV